MAAWTAASWCGLGCAPGGIPVFGSIPPAAAATAASDDVGGNHCCCIATGSMAKELVAGAPGLWLVIVAAGDRGAAAGGVEAPGHGRPTSDEGNSSQFISSLLAKRNISASPFQHGGFEPLISNV